MRNRLTAPQLAGLLELELGDFSFADENALRGLGLIEFVGGIYKLTGRGQAHIDAVLSMPLPEWEPGRWRTGYYEWYPSTPSEEE